MIGGLLRALAIACSAASLLACGSGTQTAGIDRGGVTTPVAVVGPITGFGSIIVNRVHYSIDRAAIQVDGDVASPAELELGQIVTVVGERDADGAAGTADSVRFQTNVRGPVATIDAAASELTVLDQRVIVRSSTVLELDALPAAFASIAVGDFVAVSGFVSAHGSIQATRVESVAPSRGLLVLGVVSDLHTAALRFNLGALVVDYSQAVLIEGFASGAPSDGDRVVVKGTSVAPSGALLATEIRRAAEDENQAGREVEVEGLITRFTSPLDFDVAGRQVSTTAATQYRGGGAAALALNVMVEVAGVADSAGVIVARSIEIGDEAETDD